MKRQHLNPETISPAVGGYSHGVEITGATRTLYISGQIPENPDGAVPADFAGQCEAVWQNIGEVLRAGRMRFENLVKITTYLTHPDQAEANSRIRRRFLGETRPALTVIVAQTLQSSWLLEIDAIAVAAAEEGREA